MPRDFHTVIKHPSLCSPSEHREFAALVRKGDEVAPGLSALMRDAETLAMLYEGAKMIGTAGIKNPRNSYRAKVFGKAKSDLPATEYPFELGWIFIDEPGRDKHLSGGLVDKALSAVRGKSVYATTRQDNGRMQTVLHARGFVPSGKPYASGQHQGTDLILYVRPASGISTPA